MERYVVVDNCIYDYKNLKERAVFGNISTHQNQETAITVCKALNTGKADRQGFIWTKEEVKWSPWPEWNPPQEWIDEDIVDLDFKRQLTYWRNYYG
jgi:hypothetical protein